MPAFEAMNSSRSNSLRVNAGRFAGDGCFASFDVDREVVEPQERAVAARSLRAPQHGTNPSDDLAWRERLRDVVVGAQIQADDAVRFLSAGGQHDDRHARDASQPREHLQPVDPREHEVEEHQPGLARVESLERLCAVLGGAHVEAVPLEVPARTSRTIGSSSTTSTCISITVSWWTSDVANSLPPAVRGW